MNLQNIIQTEQAKYGENETLFFAAVAHEILEQSHNFSLLEAALEVKKNLKAILEEKVQQGRFSLSKKEKPISVVKHLEQHCATQRQLLDCPTNDEHVILLAALKGLEEL